MPVKVQIPAPLRSLTAGAACAITAGAACAITAGAACTITAAATVVLTGTTIGFVGIVLL